MKKNYRNQNCLSNHSLRKPQRIFIECTTTLFSGHQTGIPRVVKNLIIRCNELSRIFNIPIFPLVFFFGKSWTFSNTERTLQKIKVFFKLKDKIEKLMAYWFVHLRKSKMLEKAIPPRNKNYFKIFYPIFHFIWYCARICVLFPFFQFKSITLLKEDLIIVADIFWVEHVLSQLENISKKGVTIVSIIYDLFLLKENNPYYEHLKEKFYTSFNRLCFIANGMIGVSNNTLMQINHFLEKEGSFNKDLILDYFYPGSDFKKIDPKREKKGSIERWPNKLWEGKEVYLMVGTLEPRKNYGFVLDVFEQMWKKGIDLNLLIIGRIGWKCEEMLERLKKSPYRERNLFIYHDADDEELLYCYQKATALILASYAEGFGLPMIEAMRFGLPVVASDIEVFREIGGDYPIYFSLDSKESLIDAIQRVPKNKKSPKEWISWDESAKNLITKALLIYAKQKDKKGITDL